MYGDVLGLVANLAVIKLFYGGPGDATVAGVLQQDWLGLRDGAGGATTQLDDELDDPER